LVVVAAEITLKGLVEKVIMAVQVVAVELLEQIFTLAVLAQQDKETTAVLTAG
jgi:hypothetical protein